MDTIRIPCRILLYTKKDGKKKFFSLNLNIYRNTHHAILSRAKKTYSELLRPLLSNVKPKKEVSLTYKLFLSNKRRIDPNNFYYIVSKFFEDSLVENKILEDDNYTIIKKTTFEEVEIDGSLDYHQCEVVINKLK